jgi:hypothetical protein
VGGDLGREDILLGGGDGLHLSTLTLRDKNR